MVKFLKALLDLIKVTTDVLNLSEEDRTQISENVSALKEACDRAVASPGYRLAVRRFVGKVLIGMTLSMAFAMFCIFYSANMKSVFMTYFGKYSMLANGLWDILPPLFTASFCTLFSTSIFIALVRLMKYEKWVDRFKRIWDAALWICGLLVFLTVSSAVFVALCTGNTGPFVKCLASLCTNNGSHILLLYLTYISTVGLFAYMCVVEIPNTCRDAAELSKMAVSAVKKKCRKKKKD